VEFIVAAFKLLFFVLLQAAITDSNYLLNSCGKKVRKFLIANCAYLPTVTCKRLTEKS
jgi:hypothetical protein